MRVYIPSCRQEGVHMSLRSWPRTGISALLGKEPHSHPNSAADISVSLGVKQDTNNSDLKMLVPHTMTAHNQRPFLDSFSGWLKRQVSAYQPCRYFMLLACGQLGPVHSLSYRKSGTAFFVITSLKYVCLPSGFGNTFWLVTLKLDTSILLAIFPISISYHLH